MQTARRVVTGVFRSIVALNLCRRDSPQGAAASNETAQVSFQSAPAVPGAPFRAYDVVRDEADTASFVISSMKAKRFQRKSSLICRAHAARTTEGPRRSHNWPGGALESCGRAKPPPAARQAIRTAAFCGRADLVDGHCQGKGERRKKVEKLTKTEFTPFLKLGIKQLN